MPFQEVKRIISSKMSMDYKSFMLCIAVVFTGEWLLPEDRLIHNSITAIALLTMVYFGYRIQKHRLKEIEEIETLRAFIKVCAWCKKIKVDGEWVPLEEYMKNAHDLDSSHGICPTCLEQVEKTEMFTDRENRVG